MNRLKWKEWNEEGFIPGPQESELEFSDRVAFCKHLLEKLTDQMGCELPFSTTDQVSPKALSEGFQIAKNKYGILPEWVPIFFSNYQLAPWHGGCAWIFQLNTNTPMAAFLQLRNSFRYKKTYLGLYDREELIAHELAHVGRMMLQEPRFEELLAYRSSPSKFRQFFGPLIQSARESLFFIFSLGVVLFFNFALIALNSSFSLSLALWSWLFPFLLLVLALVRLIKKQTIFQKGLANLEKIYQDSNTAQHLIYRLTDHEIDLFSHLSLDEIRSYILSQSSLSFRWEFLNSLYSFDE